MAAQAVNRIDYEWFTYRRVRVLRALAQFRTEREGAANLGIEYTSFRGTVQEVKNKTGLHDVRDMAAGGSLRDRNGWPGVAEQGGVRQEGDGS